MNLSSIESINSTNIEYFTASLSQFLYDAAGDVSYKKSPHYHNSNVLEQFNYFKKCLSLPKENDYDFINHIINTDRASNGWFSSSNNINYQSYPISQNDIKFDTDKNESVGHFSGKIAFRKELLEAAIKGGYLENVNKAQLFSSVSTLPITVSGLIEHCPSEVLALNQNNVKNIIKELVRIQFISPDNGSIWEQSFKEKMIDFPDNNEKPGLIKSIQENIQNFRNMFSPINTKKNNLN